MVVDLSILPLFLAAITALVLSPGPDLVLISSYSSTQGFKAGLMISVGVFGAGVLQTALVAFGLGAVMQAIPVFAYTIKFVGVFYLAYLGVRMIRSWLVKRNKSVIVKTAQKNTYIQLFRLGLLNNLLNPKALLFFSLFLPQFISGSGSVVSQIYVLGLILSAYAFAVNSVISYAFSKIGALIGSKLNIGKHVEGFLGVIFLGLAVRLGTSKT